MKYLIINQSEIEIGIIFDELLSHADIANALRWSGRDVISAGFCNPHGITWGGSVSLGIKSRSEDQDIIQATINRSV